MFRNEKGFTLIEMLVVLLIITVLILLIVPNLGNRAGNMHDEGCEALVVTVQAQADMYKVDTGDKADTMDVLIDEYINEGQTTCQNGKKLTISNGKVSVQ